MASFRYRAITRVGREAMGHIAARDHAAARAVLESQGLYLLALTESSDHQIGLRGWARTSVGGFVLGLPFLNKTRIASSGDSSDKIDHMSRKNIALFTRQLATLVAAVPLEEALRLLGQQSEERRVRAVILRLHGGLIAGLPLAEAMAQVPRSFPSSYRAMIAAGEASGRLSTILLRLAAMLERQMLLRNKLLAALAYPMILALVACGVVVALMIFIVPRIAEQFDDVGQQLPMVTRAMIALSDFMVHWWWGLALVFAAGIVAGGAALRLASLRYHLDRIILRLPLVGRLVRNVHAAAFARMLATMVASQLPLVEGVRLTIPMIRNRALSLAVGQIAEQLRAGESLATGLRKAGLFPSVLVYLTASGESVGQLDSMLERAADYLEQDSERFTASAMALLEPGIILIMGFFVALVILSILLPILQLQNLAGL